MQVSIDKFGRILIPKELRSHLGIKPGSVFEISERNHEILLKLFVEKPLLQKKGNVLVFTGEATEDIESELEKLREERFKDLFE